MYLSQVLMMGKEVNRRDTDTTGTPNEPWNRIVVPHSLPDGRLDAECNWNTVGVVVVAVEENPTALLRTQLAVPFD